VEALVAALDDSIGSVTIAAAGALGRIGKPAVPSLIEKLKAPHFQQLVSTVLGEMGADAADAVPALQNLLNSKDAEARREAIIALAEIGPAAKTAVPDLIKILDEKEFPNRGAAAYALGKIGAKEATNVLKSAVETPDDPMLRLASIWALLQFDPANDDYAKIAVPRLIAALSSERPRIRKEAAVTLGKLGAKSASAVADLQKALGDQVLEVRIDAIAALAEIGSASKPVVPDLTALLSDEELPALRQSAAYALGRIGSDAKSAAPALHRMAASRSNIERTVAAWALVQIAPDAENVKMAIPLLIQALEKSPRPEVRIEAARALGQIGSGSAPVAAALKAASNDSDAAVRKAAEEALAKRK
jgi:HEAT repeat protein